MRTNPDKDLDLTAGVGSGRNGRLVDNSVEPPSSNVELRRFSLPTSHVLSSNNPVLHASSVSVFANTSNASLERHDKSSNPASTAPGLHRSDAVSTNEVTSQLNKSGSGTVFSSTKFAQARPSALAEIKRPVSTLDSDSNVDELDQDYEQDEGLQDEEANEGTAISHVADLKRQQRATFDSWIAETAAKTTEEEMEQTLKAQPDEAMTKRALVSNQASQLIVNTPREYQLEMFERAKKRNTIAVLDTGSGKTLIAVLLLKHIIDQELERRRAGNSPKISFFLVNSVSLVFQQSAVLERNLNHSIKPLCGSMGIDTWNETLWQDTLVGVMVVVCTAEILFQCLVHSFLTIEHINLLIFDEAHHTKKEHPYARIVRTFYRPQQDLSKRPRIFAMTASPIDAKGDISRVASKLEDLLDSRIATVSDLSLIQRYISRPAEEIATYDLLQTPFEAPLHQKLQADFGDLRLFRKLFTSSKTIASELGPWCADAWWLMGLEENKLARLAKKAEHQETLSNGHVPKNSSSPEAIAQLDDDIDLLGKASRVAQAYCLGLPRTEQSDDLSSKLRNLIRWIRIHYEHSTSARCIVFVERRDTARLLEKIFKYEHVSGPYLRAAFFVGSGSTGLEEMATSTRQQLLIMTKFRRGEVNLLFATSVAEEGLDIPDCSLVIRFDLYKTMISYMQSRGRARHRNSKYLHMVEKDNRNHAQLVKHVRQAEEMMRRFCQSLPADRLLDEPEEDCRQQLADTSDQRVYEHPETKAILTYQSSLHILQCFVASLPHTADVSVEPLYMTVSHGDGFVSEVSFPENCPIQSIRGRTERRKLTAKCSAAFDACLKLIEGGHLDAHLMSTQRKRLPVMRNAQLALDSKSNMYEMMIKPEIWKLGQGTIPSELYLTILDLPAGYDRPHSPIALLTRTWMPDFPRFPLFLLTGSESLVQTTGVERALKISMEQLEQIDFFTRTIYHDIFAKEFEADIPKMSYWFAPLSIQPGTSIGTLEPTQAVDWDTLKEVWQADQFTWNSSWANGSLVDKFFSDPYDGGKRYFSIGVEKTLNLDSPVPEGIENADKRKKTIKEFTVSLWSKSARKREEYDPYNKEQPVLHVERMIQRRNLLDIPTNAEKESRLEAFVIPQPLKRSPLSTRIAAMGLTLPGIIHRIESYLIAMETCQFLGLSIPLDLALEAITKDSDNTEEHRLAQVHLQRGMGKNYERLEFLGDAFLKMATSIAIYTQNPDDDEFEFHVKRMLLVCNRTLFGRAKELQLTRYVRSQSFSRRLWYQQGLKLLKGKKLGKEGEKYEHSLGDKTIADICEALIGAAFLAHNRQGSWNPSSWRDAIHAVTTFVDSSDHLHEKWEDYAAGYIRPSWEGKHVSAAQVDLATKVEHEHPYHFHSPQLLQVCFKHPSYPRAYLDLPSYQRLEFLGDSLLELACVTHLFYRYPTKDPQWLTEHKMAMVSNRFLGALCVKLGFHKHLLSFSNDIKMHVVDYVTDIEEAAGSANGARDYWTNVKPPPKCLPDIVESYIGAVFIDSNFDYNEVQRFFDKHIKPFFEDMEIYDSFANNHPVTRLQSLLDGLGCSGYRIMASEVRSLDQTRTPTSMAAVMVHGEIIGEGKASSGKNAKVKASKDALEKIEGLAAFQFQTRFGCNCRPGDDAVLVEGVIGGDDSTAI
ncbi:MAG: Dicer-like protein 1 [Bathelium mastoideum]|nr:MAG: Dicer-like protein 1 [Bathelium mastoideum]